MKTFILIFLLFQTFQINAQPPVEWVEAMGTSSTDWTSDMVLDEEGNMYITGTYDGIMDIDPGNGQLLINSGGAQSMFVQKLSSTGELIWYYALNSGSSTNGYGIDIDNQGNVYVVGYFQSATDFDTGTGTSYVFALGTSGGFVLKLNSSGQFAWVHGMLGTSGGDAQRIVFDGANAIYVCGLYAGTMDANPGAGTNTLTSTGGLDLYIVKLTGSGTHVWSGSIGADEFQNVQHLETDNEGNLIVAGNFAGTGDFDPTSGVATLSNNFYTDGFLIKTTSAGDFIFAQSYGGSDNEEIYDLSIDPSNNIFITGHFSGSVDFDNNAQDNILTSLGSSDIFLLKISPDGTLLWAKSTGSTTTDQNASIAIDDLGNIYMSIGFGTLGFDFDFSENVNSLVSTGTGGDTGLSKYDSDGNFIWVTSFGGEQSEQPTLIKAFDEDIIYMTGIFNGSASFSNDPDAQQYISQGGQDIFALRMSCISYGTQTVDACNSFTWPVNGTTYSTDGTYAAAIPNAAGCDSIITLTLDITLVSDLATTNGNTMSAAQNGAVYQWFTCDEKMMPINNATAQSYTATSNGSYAVQVTLDGCVVLSNCMDITGIDVEELGSNVINVVPNPTSGRINLSTMIQADIITLYDLQGKVTLEIKPISVNPILDLTHLTPSIYFIKVQYPDGTVSCARLVKE